LPSGKINERAAILKIPLTYRCHPAAALQGGRSAEFPEGREFFVSISGSLADSLGLWRNSRDPNREFPGAEQGTKSA
jgi:hypothetical protein